jgi:predicted dinucleotide-binding enzyme
MTVGIVGAGRMGLSLARAVAATGEEVLLSSGRWDGPVPPAVSRCRSVPLAALWRQSGTVLLALPFAAAFELMRGTAARLGEGRVLIDVTNPRLSAGVPPTPRSGGELIAEAAPTWRVAKAFNTIPAAVLDASRIHHCPVSLPVAGAPVARSVASALARRLGFDPLDAGGIAASRELESLAVLLVRLSDAHQLHGRIAIHIGQPERPPVPLRAVALG